MDDQSTPTADQDNSPVPPYEDSEQVDEAKPMTTTADFPKYFMGGFATVRVEEAEPEEWTPDTVPGGWTWHAFHQEVLSFLDISLNERYEEIVENKPKREHARRNRMLRHATDIPLNNYYRTVVSLDDYPWLRELHDQQCEKNQPLGCPWVDEQADTWDENGDQVRWGLFPELPNTEVGVSAEHLKMYLGVNPDEPELV